MYFELVIDNYATLRFTGYMTYLAFRLLLSVNTTWPIWHPVMSEVCRVGPSCVDWRLELIQLNLYCTEARWVSNPAGFKIARFRNKREREKRQSQ